MPTRPKPQHAVRPPTGRPRLTVAAVVVLFGLTIAAGPSGPEAILEELRATDRARQTDATEAQAWAEEKARLELLIAAAKEETTTARQRRKDAKTALKTLTAAGPAPSEDRTLEVGAARVAEAIERRLDAFGRAMPPGVIPQRGPRRADAREALDRALHRLERAERNAQTISVTIAPGEGDGGMRSVEVVRFGGVAAWWRSLDGQQGGQARMVDGTLRLYPIDRPEDLDAIALASAIAKGRRAPEVVLLPVRYARTSTKGSP